MANLRDLLDADALNSLQMCPGTVLLGEMDGVDHLKFYVVAAVANDKVCICSVIINSRINPFIQKRPHLLARQVQINAADYDFLDHDSYINCAQPWKVQADYFHGFTQKGCLSDADLQRVRTEIINSGMLTDEERELYNLL